MEFTPRPAQDQILAYQQGTMGVSAVPGSGKTWTLSLLAARLITANLLEDDQEILIVTLVNSAVRNFALRISAFLKASDRIPSLGYRVRTLHGLAHDIVKERPDLAGLDSSFQIIDDREAERIRTEAIYNWMRENPQALDGYFSPDIKPQKKAELYQKQVPILLDQVALQFIRSSKNWQLSPEYISGCLADLPEGFPLSALGRDIYRVYQRNLEYRGAVDFDDLIGHAYKILLLDSSLLERLQNKWPYILEDEAQDSSLMQQKILSLLASRPSGTNWVRMGDPNQAIYETFTTADPQLLIDFIQQADLNYSLPNSGRSSETIIGLANHLVDWTSKSHPRQEVRDALYPNYIQPAPAGDSQENPPSLPDQIHLHQQALAPDEEIDLVASSVARWLKSHPDQTVAVLAPRNERGKKLTAHLRTALNVEPIELLNTTLATRKTTGALVIVLNYLLDPLSVKKLAAVYRVWQRDLQGDPVAWESIESDAGLIGSVKYPESFISPGPAADWLSSLSEQDDQTLSRLLAFAQVVAKWQLAVLLPFDQLILTLALDLFHSPEELSLAHRLADFIKTLADQHPDWDLTYLLDELKSLARNERRFFPGSEDIQFNPEDHKGQVVVTTAHKAKGLEWDRVYLLSANNYNFPSGSSADSYISEKWFIRDNLNLPEEALAQLAALIPETAAVYSEGSASQQARLDYVRERLRLFYVAITRAKQELIITWNTGRNHKAQPALAFQALIDFTVSGGSS